MYGRSLGSRADVLPAGEARAPHAPQRIALVALGTPPGGMVRPADLHRRATEVDTPRSRRASQRESEPTNPEPADSRLVQAETEHRRQKGNEPRVQRVQGRHGVSPWPLGGRNLNYLV